MGLSGQQRKELQDALIDAFPDKTSLERILSFELEKNLNAIAGEGNLNEIVFKLIKKAEAENWVENLIDAALKSNPENSCLKAFVKNINENEYGITDRQPLTSSYKKGFKASKYSKATDNKFTSIGISLLLVIVGISTFFWWIHKNPSTETSNSEISIAEDPPSIVSKEVKFNPKFFQRVKVIETEGGWEDLTSNLSEYKKCRNSLESGVDVIKILDNNLEDCDFTFRFLGILTKNADYLAFGLGQESPVFDILFVNNSSEDLTVTQLGVEILDTRFEPWSAGNPEPQKIPVVDKYSVYIPDNLCSIKPTWELEEGECNLPKKIDIELRDPYFLTPGTAFRYNIEIIDIGLKGNSGNATVVRFYLHTNHGKAFSGRVYIKQ